MFPFLEQILNEDERLLSRIEQSWGDCAAGFRTGIRAKRNPKKHDEIRGLGLLNIHETLEVHRKAFEAGDMSHLLWALRLCLVENLPPPYWCADGILERLSKVENEVSSLHDLFGLSELGFKANGKSGLNYRKRQKQALDLYVKVWELKALKPAISKEAAIREVIKKFNLPFRQGTARKLFDEKEREQAPLRKANGIRFGGLRF